MLRDIVSPSSQKTKQTIEGVMLFYDNSRTRYLSASRESLHFGVDHKNILNDRYLMLISGIVSNVSGYKLYRNATITSLSVQTQNISNCIFRIRRNSNLTDIITISLNSEISKVIDNINIDLNKDDYLQCYMNVISGNVDYPVLSIEFAWR